MQRQSTGIIPMACVDTGMEQQFRLLGSPVFHRFQQGSAARLDPALGKLPEGFFAG